MASRVREGDALGCHADAARGAATGPSRACIGSGGGQAGAREAAPQVNTPCSVMADLADILDLHFHMLMSHAKDTMAGILLVQVAPALEQVQGAVELAPMDKIKIILSTGQMVDLVGWWVLLDQLGI